MCSLNFGNVEKNLTLFKSSLKTLSSYLRGFLDRVDAENSDTIARNNTVTEEPINEELHVTRHLAMRNRIRRFLELQDLEVVAPHLVGHDEERIQRTFGTSGLKQIC